MNTDKKKIKKRYKDYPSNVPRILFKRLKQFGFNRSALALGLDINSGHLSKLLNNGIEPKDNEIRKKLGLKIIRPAKKQAVRQHREIPDFIKTWNHLPTAERHNVIKTYLNWKEKQ